MRPCSVPSDRALANLRRKLVRRPARHRSTFSEVGASEKPGVVQADLAWPRAPSFSHVTLCHLKNGRHARRPTRGMSNLADTNCGDLRCGSRSTRRRQMQKDLCMFPEIRACPELFPEGDDNPSASALARDPIFLRRASVCQAYPAIGGTGLAQLRPSMLPSIEGLPTSRPVGHRSGRGAYSR